MNIIKRAMKNAIKAIRRNSDGRDYFVGASISRGSRILSTAQNSPKSPKQIAMKGLLPSLLSK